MSDLPLCEPPGPPPEDTLPADAPQSSQNPSCQITQESRDAHMTTVSADLSGGSSTINTFSGQVQSADDGRAPSGHGPETSGMECEQELKSSGPEIPPTGGGDSGHVPVDSNAADTNTHEHIQGQVHAPSGAGHPPQQEPPKQPVTGDFLALGSPGKPRSPPGEDGPLSRHTHRSRKKRRSHKLKKRSSRELLGTGGGQSLSLGQSQDTSAQIESDILQIDSILKALNTGSFDAANMQQISQLTGSAPATVQVPSSAVQGPMVGVRGQSVSSEQSHDSSTSDSGSSTDSSDDSEEDDIWRRGGGGGRGGRAGGEGQRDKMEDHQTFPKTKGETDYRDLPPVERCDVSFPDNGRLLPIGTVSHHTEQLLVVESLPNTPPVDEGTVLWSKDKTSIAKVFETFGPVKRPFYSIRINSLDDLPLLGVAMGDMVYVVPADLSLTRYVFSQELMKDKGSDASWKDDNEVPQEFKDYSDDESEQKAKKGKGPRSDRQQQKSQSSLQNPSSSSSSSSSSAPPPKSSPVRRQPSVTYTSDPKMQQYFVRGPPIQPPVSHPQYHGYPPPPLPMPYPPGPYPYPPPPPHSTVPPNQMRGAYPQPLLPGGQPHQTMPGQRPSMMPPPHLPPHYPY